MNILSDIHKDIFQAAYGFPPWNGSLEDGSGRIAYVWAAHPRAYYGAELVAGVSAFELHPETFQPVVLWRRGLFVTNAGLKRYLNSSGEIVPRIVDLGEQDVVADALQNLCALSFSRTFTSMDDPRMPSLDVLVRSSIGAVDIRFGGYNDSPDYIAFWETITQAIDRYLELYDDPELYREMGFVR